MTHSQVTQIGSAYIPDRQGCLLWSFSWNTLLTCVIYALEFFDPKRPALKEIKKW